MMDDVTGGWELLLKDLEGEAGKFDRQIQEWLGSHQGRIHCARGCRNCCNLAVNATFPEALVIANALDLPQRAVLREEVGRLRPLLDENNDLKGFLRRHRKIIGSCPFLDEGGACAIYDRRPFSCRSLLSTRPGDWCGVDFAELSPLERQLFMDSLDRSVVAFPAHYVALTRDLGAGHEDDSLAAMSKLCGFSLSGNLKVLVHLECEHRLSSVALKGLDAAVALVESTGLHHPFLLTFGP